MPHRPQWDSSDVSELRSYARSLTSGGGRETQRLPGADLVHPLIMAGA